ncbi:MAG: hypothetical protein ABIT36_08600 [Steroidobacteraceae bacterium]
MLSIGIGGVIFPRENSCEISRFSSLFRVRRIASNDWLGSPGWCALTHMRMFQQHLQARSFSLLNSHACGSTTLPAQIASSSVPEVNAETEAA